MPEFHRDSKTGRPEGTSVTEYGVVHYTCNPPKQNILDQMGIVGLGIKFGVGAVEVLLIPVRFFINRGINPDTASAEQFLRDIDRD